MFDPVEKLKEFIRHPSVSTDSKFRAGMKGAQEFVSGLLGSLGFSVDVVKTDLHPIIFAQRGGEKHWPHVLIYGHYDVQPAKPLELWTSPPFEPRIESGALFGRGSSDNKGQHLAHLNAVEAFLKTGTELPCNLTFVIEGEEEVGSEHLGEFLKNNRAELKCDAVVISDNGIPSLRHPALTYGLRGIMAFEIIVHGPSRDLHSGIYGGTLDNPAMALSQMLAKLYDAEVNYEKLKQTTAENNPLLISVVNEMEKIRPGILETIRSQRRNLQAGQSRLK